MSQFRLDESLTRINGSCDVCGSENKNGYVRVTYAATKSDQHTVIQRECFDCHQDGKCRDKKRKRGEFEPVLH